MKNRLLYWTAFAFAALGMTACNDESTAGMTRITYYPELTLAGETAICMDKGGTFSEPGYTAVMNGEDVTDQVQVTSNINSNVSGQYSVTYSIANADGIAATASRVVVVADPNDPPEGMYFTDPASYRLYNGATASLGGSYMIVVLGNGDGTYHVDDLLGGWYWRRSGYGTAYALEGTVTIDADGNIGLVDSYLSGWGDSANDLTDGHFDAATGTMSWNVSYTEYPMNFYVTMYK